MYTAERDLQKETGLLIDKRIKEIIDERLKRKVLNLKSQKFENDFYYKRTEVANTLIPNLSIELSRIISDTLNTKDVDVTKIKSYFIDAYRKPLFHKENINNFVEDFISKYNFK
jgi:hypothetical protein